MTAFCGTTGSYAAFKKEGARLAGQMICSAIRGENGHGKPSASTRDKAVVGDECLGGWDTRRKTV